MKTIRKVLLSAVIASLLTSCAIIKPGEVGVKRKLGKLSEKVLDQGAHAYNPFVTRIVKTPIRTVNLEVTLNLPSREGLNISSNISILYKIEKNSVPMLIENLGDEYEQIIRSVFRSSSADICAKYMAKDMHSGKRSEIEKEIASKMSELLKNKGIIIDAVLLKSIQLPPGLYSSIEQRLEAEQASLRMKFILEQERREAERKVIEAIGNRDAQKILSEGLTKEILELKSIEAFIKLSRSPGSKVIITDGASPFLIDTENSK